MEANKPKRRRPKPVKEEVKRHELTLDEVQAEITKVVNKVGYTQSSATIGITAKLAVIAEIHEAWRYYHSEVTEEVKELASDTIGQLLWHLTVYAADMNINVQDALLSACPDYLPKRIPFGTSAKHWSNSMALVQYNSKGGRPGEKERNEGSKQQKKKRKGKKVDTTCNNCGKSRSSCTCGCYQSMGDLPPMVTRTTTITVTTPKKQESEDVD